MEVIFSDEMRALDAAMIRDNKIPGLLLMESAAEGLFNACMEFGDTDSQYVIFCGTGNNGGDGLALARKLLTEEFNVHVYLLGKTSDIKGDAKTNADYFIKTKTLNTIKTSFDVDQALLNLSKSDVIVDAIFGIGLSREIAGIHRDAIERINACPAKTICVDIPSGVSADTGQILGIAVDADFTLTFQHPKPGHFIFPGRDLKGNLRVKKIGIEHGITRKKAININAYSRMSHELSLKKRDSNTHKGTYGSLALVCASIGMTGAGIMAAKAALKGGVGLLSMCIPEPVAPVFQTAVPQGIIVPLPADDKGYNDITVYALDDIISVMDALVIGPGISTNDDVTLLVNRVMTSYDLPKVIDADALTIVSKSIQMLENKTGEVVFTPHPKEFSRLTGLSVEAIMSDPINHVVDYAKNNGVIVLLKGATTYIANPFGDVALVLTGSPGMAKGGSGDVLSGLIGALMAQKLSAFDAAVMGAYIAGIAGEMAAADKGEYSMTPIDTIDQIAKALTEI